MDFNHAFFTALATLALVGLGITACLRQRNEARRYAEQARDNLEEFRIAAKLAIQLSALPPCDLCSRPAAFELEPDEDPYRVGSHRPRYCGRHAPEGCAVIPEAKPLRLLLIALDSDHG